MMNIKLLFCLPLLLLMSSCKTQTSQTETTTVTNNTIIIGINKTAKIPNSKISLEFKNISEDSRCPVDANCVWEGIAIVSIEGISGNNQTNFQVGTRNFIPKNVTKSFSFSGYTFILVDLKPQPGGKEKNESVTFKYEKEL